MYEDHFRDPEAGEDYDRPRDQFMSAPNQQRPRVFVDSSGPLFSMYSKAAEEDDRKMIERWRKDAEEILIFTGLFSAAVAALLAVTLQYLIPNSQDTSSFYLGNIYGILADPNATRTPTPSPVARPPPFSPPRYAIWVNSLWFLSLLISLTCALWASSLQQWARRYIRIAQRAGRSPEKRARMRAFYAKGVEILPNAWLVEGLPTLLHLSLFLFFAGTIIFLFNINHAVFYSVGWWIGPFSIVYGLITLLPFLRHDSPYYSPLSPAVWLIYSGISYLIYYGLVFKIGISMVFGVSLRLSQGLQFFQLGVLEQYLQRLQQRLQRMRHLIDRLRNWSFGREKAAEDTVSEQLSVIDADILHWTIDTFGDDDRMEEFFHFLPGFFNSMLVKDLKSNLPDSLRMKFWLTLNGFIERTLSSNSVDDSLMDRRLGIGMNAMDMIVLPDISKDILFEPWDQVPQDIDIGYALARWCASSNRDIARYAQCMATRILAGVRERDGRWIKLATGVLGLSERNLRDYIASGNDSVSLAILISVAHRDIHSDFYDWGVLSTLYKLNIHNTLPELQNAFCALWNLCVEGAQNQGTDSYPLGILRLTRFLYIRLHQGTHAAPTRFSASTPDYYRVLSQPSSYPLCTIPSHRLVSIIPESHPEIGETSQTPSASSPAPQVYTTARPAGGRRSGGILAAAAQDLPSTAALSHLLECNKQQDIATSRITAEMDQVSFNAPASSPGPTSATPVLDEPLTSYDPGLASTSKLPPALNTELLPPLSCKSLPNQLDNAPLPRLRARGLINEGNMCFVNAALQSLVHVPPFLKQLRDIGHLMGYQPGSGTTVLVDATFRLLDDFVYKDRPSLTQQPMQLTEKGKARENGTMKEGDGSDSFLPTYVYDAMKEKEQFKNMLDGRQQDAEGFLGVYLDALDEELSSFLKSSSTYKLTSTTIEVEELNEGSQLGEGQTQSGVGKRDSITSSIESPISRIFNGKFRTNVRMADQPDSVKVESRRSLQVDIQPDSVRTVQDALALAHISKSQSQVARVGPSGTGKGVTAVLIETLPPVLVIHLKRFSSDVATGGIFKNRKPIQLTPELDIPPDVMAPAAAGQPALSARYTLYGVLYHHGPSASGGHYTVDVLHPNSPDGSGGGNDWLHIDDETVSAVRHEDVFGRHDDNEPPADDQCAYLLFYCRTDSAP